MFEEASRLKLRFETKRGLITTEDVWDLPLESGAGVSLDELAKSLNRAVKESAEESFVRKQSRESSILTLKLDIVKHIIKFKLEEIEENEKALLNRNRKSQILDIIAKKENESLEDMDLGALKEMAAEL